jgi:hypothetical protein
LFINFMASLILVVFGIFGVVVAARLWTNTAAIKLIGWPALGTQTDTPVEWLSAGQCRRLLGKE